MRILDGSLKECLEEIERIVRAAARNRGAGGEPDSDSQNHHVHEIIEIPQVVVSKNCLDISKAPAGGDIRLAQEVKVRQEELHLRKSAASCSTNKWKYERDL